MSDRSNHRPSLMEPAQDVDIVQWLALAAAPETMVETLADGNAARRLAGVGKAIVYLREANANLTSTVGDLRRIVATLAAQPGEGR